MPKVSIIIATHNRAHFLPRAVASAHQAGSDIEVVVVDDASTDNTPEVCRTLSGIRYVRVERSQRLGGARNLGIMASSGEFIAFLDDDDLRLPGSLDVQAEALASAPKAGLVYGQTVLGDQNCVPTGSVYPEHCPQGDIFWELLERNFIGCPAAVFRRSCLYTVGLPGITIHGIEDWDLWIRIAEMYPVISVEQPVAIYRRGAPGSGQFTSDAAAMVRRITTAHRERWMTLPRALDAPARQRRLAQRSFSRNMATHLIWETGRSLRYHNFPAARKNLLTAMTLHPKGFIHRTTRPSNFRFILSRAVGLSRRHGVKEPM